MFNDFGDKAHLGQLERQASRKPQLRDQRKQTADDVMLTSAPCVAGAAGIGVFAVLNLFS